MNNRELSLEEIHAIDLALLDGVHSFCEKHGLTYYLAYGTLLGAIREGGFIPWDDDMDIWMMRDDFDRFIVEYACGDSTALIAPCSKGYRFEWAKLVDTRTMYRNDSAVLPDEYGTSIDIFPLDSNASIARFNLMKRHERMRTKAYTFRPGDSGIKRVARRLAQVIISPLIGLTAQELIRGKYSANSRSVIMNYCGYGFEKAIYPRLLFGEPKLVCFEGNHQYYAPSQPEELLSLIYGDSWRTPLEAKRHAAIYWRTEQ